MLRNLTHPPMHLPAAPCRLHRYADIIIPWQRGDNLVAIDLITQHIKSKLSCHELVRHYPNLEIMPSNFQVGQRTRETHDRAAVTRAPCNSTMASRTASRTAGAAAAEAAVASCLGHVAWQQGW